MLVINGIAEVSRWVRSKGVVLTGDIVFLCILKLKEYPEFQRFSFRFWRDALWAWEGKKTSPLRRKPAASQKSLPLRRNPRRFAENLAASQKTLPLHRNPCRFTEILAASQKTSPLHRNPCCFTENLAASQKTWSLSGTRSLTVTPNEYILMLFVKLLTRSFSCKRNQSQMEALHECILMVYTCYFWRKFNCLQTNPRGASYEIKALHNMNEF